MHWKTEKRIWTHGYKAIAHVWYIEILTRLRGFLLISLYLVWFSLCSSLFWELRDIRSGEKFASLTLKPRSRDRILIYRYYSIQMWSLRQTLSLRNFFNEDPGHRLPARGGITSDSMLTITNLESHAHPSFVNVVTMPLNTANTVNIVSVTLPHLHNTVNG